MTALGQVADFCFPESYATDAAVVEVTVLSL